MENAESLHIFSALQVLHAIAGAGGGVLSMVLTYPLITLSTRSQVESKRAQTSVLDAVRKIIAREGVSGLFAGLESAVFGISVTNFVYYYCKRESPPKCNEGDGLYCGEAVEGENVSRQWQETEAENERFGRDREKWIYERDGMNGIG